MKRILSIVLAFSMFMSLLAGMDISVFAEEVPTGMSDNMLWQYEMYDEGIELINYLGSAADVYIPSELEVDGVEHAVIRLGNGLFENNDSLNSVTLGDGILEIGSRAFYDADNLVCILTNEQLTTIGNEAFYSCDKFNSIILYDALVSIGEDAFAECPNLTVWCNEGTVGHTYVLENNMTYEILNPDAEPETVLKDGVTYYVMNGKSIAIDFDESTTEVVVPAYIDGYPVTELRGTFADCDEIVRVEVSEGVSVIGSRTFRNCTKLQTVILPESLTEIQDRAFAYCEKLEEIKIPDNVTTIGEYGFYGCSSLQEIIIPEQVTSIEFSLLEACTNLREITMSPHTTSIDARAFRDCTSLEKINIPENVTVIYYHTFYNCTSLREVTLPEGLRTIESTAFYNCTSIQTIIIPKSVTAMPKDAFPNSVILSVYEGSTAHNIAVANNMLFQIYDGETEPNVILREGVTYTIIDEKAIATDFDESTTEVVVPTYVEGYPVTELRGTFADCDEIVRVEVSEGISVIGSRTFRNCTKLQAVILPESLTEIQDRAFVNCEKLEEIKIPDNVTTIGEYGFYGCSSLQEIIIPEQVTRIETCLFETCISLREITLSSNTTDIGMSAFQDCTSLEKIEIPETVKWINYNAFYNCNSLCKVTLSEGLVGINNSAFYNCSSLRTIVIPKSVTSMPKDAFPNSVVLLVYENSTSHHVAVTNGLLYFILLDTNNPEITYGTGISGVITYTDGTVVSNAIVKILYDDGVLKETVTTDENGVYEFTYAEVGKYTIKATDAEGNTFSTTVSVKRMNVFDVFLEGDTDLTLKKGYSISGVVNQGEALVTITDQKGNVVDSVTSDAEGVFCIEDIPNGTYIIKAETQNGSICKELTVFNGNISDLTLTIASEKATVWGYVEVEDRKQNHQRRQWINVTIYNKDGVAVEQCKSDTEGKYVFENIPLGEYALVAETVEMRTDKKRDFERSYTLRGYAYVSVSESGTYQVDTIVLYEEREHTATISGKVTARGQSQVSQVILRDVFQNEIANCKTGNNGKYTFKNVQDGLYFITAVTESKGMNFVVVTVREGKVYGDTDIVVYKSNKVVEQEQNFMTEVLDCNDRETVLMHRERIAEEKSLYDGLSEKEKKQLSKAYVEKLNKYVEWLADIQYNTDEGVIVDQGGLVIAGDEIKEKDEVSFTINVTKCEKHEMSAEGVNTEKDYIQHAIEDIAGKSEIKQYYEISMIKGLNGEQKSITSVYKDTDAMGKFRITMEIPEEYRGYKHYNLVHVHHGEVVTLTDLDDNPNTVTFEVDKFSTFALTATDESLAVNGEELKFSGASLTLQNNIAVNYKVSKSLFAEGGYENPYVKFVLNGKETIISQYRIVDDKYVFDFTNIAPNQINDTIYATLYATIEGELCSSTIVEYSVASYCYNMLNKYSSDEYAEFRTLLVDLLNYGAAAQVYTQYNVNNLVNSLLTETQAAWGTSKAPELTTVFNKAYTVIDNPSVTWAGAGLLLQDSVTIRFKIVTDNIENLTVKITNNAGEEWNVSGTSFEETTGGYYVFFRGLNAGQMRESLFVTVYKGNIAVSDTVCYSIESYAYSKQNSTDENLNKLLVAMMKYGDAASSYAN